MDTSHKIPPTIRPSFVSEPNKFLHLSRSGPTSRIEGVTNRHTVSHSRKWRDSNKETPISPLRFGVDSPNVSPDLSYYPPLKRKVVTQLSSMGHSRGYQRKKTLYVSWLDPVTSTQRRSPTPSLCWSIEVMVVPFSRRLLRVSFSLSYIESDS